MINDVFSDHCLGHPGILDPWQHLFDAAAADHSEGSGGLIPYWIFTTEGGAQIERHVPALPLSKESEHLPALRNSLAVYRMVFGQPRQNDLVDYLSRTMAPEEIKARARDLGLSPSGSTLTDQYLHPSINPPGCRSFSRKPPHAVDSRGWTALHCASYRGWPAHHLAMLLRHGAGPGAHDPRGNTPLRRNRHSSVEFLRSIGAPE